MEKHTHLSRVLFVSQRKFKEKKQTNSELYDKTIGEELMDMELLMK